MKIPDKIRIGGHTVTIERGSFADIGGTSGCFVPELQKIKLLDIGPEDKIAETFLHEIIEAFKYLYQFDMPHQTLCTISESLFDVFRNNGLDFSKGEN